MEQYTPDLRQTLGALWRNKILIGGVVLAATLGAFILSSRQTELYRASARLVLRPVIAPAAFGDAGQRSGGPLGLELSPESEAEIIGSTIVAQRVAERVDVPATAEELVEVVDVAILTDELMRVSAIWTDPETASLLANGFAEEFITYRREAVASALVGHAEDLRDRVNSVADRVKTFDRRIVSLSAQAAAINAQAQRSPNEAARAGEYRAEIDRLTAERNEMLVHLASLRTRLDDARNAMTVATGGGEVVQPATPPAAASSPKPQRDALMGLMLGLVLGFGLAILRAYLDDRIRSRGAATRAAGTPLVGVIPRRQRWRRDREELVTLAEPSSPQAESFRGLRQSLVAAGLGSESHSLLITSGGRRAGRTVVAANLAVASAQAGYRVILVSADMRNGRLHELLGCSADDGLSRVLNEDRSPLEALQPTPVEGLQLLASGPESRNPASLLDRGRLARVMADLSDEADIVILDAPALASGADAFVLAPGTDATLLVLRQDAARLGGTTEAVRSLKQAGARRVFAVLNAASRQRRPSTFSHDFEIASPEPAGLTPLYVAPNGEAVTNGHVVNDASRGNGEARRSRATRSANGETKAHPTRSGSRKPKPAADIAKG